MPDAQTVADLEFITNELRRFAELEYRELFAYIREHGDTMIHSVQAPGGGHLFIGKEAYGRFWQIATRALQVRRDCSPADFDLRTVAKSLRESFTATVSRLSELPSSDDIEVMISD